MLTSLCMVMDFITILYCADIVCDIYVQVPSREEEDPGMLYKYFVEELPIMELVGNLVHIHDD